MDIGERVVKLETQMERVEAGIANFVQFQKESRDFYSRYDEREKEGRRRLNLLIALATLLAAIGLVVVSFIGIEVQSHHSLLQQLEAGSNTYQYAKFERTTK